MKHLFVVNPVAGGIDRTGHVLSLAEALFSQRPDDSFEIYVTKAPLDATREVKQRAERGEELRIYSCGGDGTLNECINGAAFAPHVAIAPYTCGTGNDFCRMFGEEKQLYANIEALINGTVTPIDLIDCNGRYSVGICSVGVDARIGTNVHNYAHLPVLGKGSMAYVTSAVVELSKKINQEMKITCNGETIGGKHALAAVCNGRFYGGGFHPCPEAMPNDGILDILIAGNITLPHLPYAFMKYASGQADSIPAYIRHLKSTEIHFEFEEETVVNLDGEQMLAKTIDMKLIPGAVNLIVPQGLTFFQ